VGDDVDRPRESVHSAKVHAHISHAVIATYAADAAGEVDGVHALLGGHFGSLDRRTDPERAAKAVRVTSRGDGIALDVHLLVEWRASIPDVAAGVDGAVRAYLSSMVDLDDVDVTVHVDGLAPAAAGAA
jgi:uncharacterized alkaline shock family protein YloU